MEQLTSTAIEDELQARANQTIACHSEGFFKTGPGGYGEGDRFLGIRVPELRKLSHGWLDIELAEAAALLRSPWHEARLLALFILVEQFKGGEESTRQAIFNLYLQNTNYVNNWDLVDSSAHLIVGPYLQDRDRSALYRLARSELIWERRIGIMATFHYIRDNSFADTLQLAEILKDDPHDLIHKAVGWMLREVGKRDHDILTGYLRKHYRIMPRTMLRYAIERFPEEERKAYLQGTA